MGVIDAWLENNSEVAYGLAQANTPRNSQGRPVIPIGDEWRKEHEWDELYKELAAKNS